MTFLKECYDWKRVILHSTLFYFPLFLVFSISQFISRSVYMHLALYISSYYDFCSSVRRKECPALLRLSYINLSFHAKFSNIFDASSISLSIIISLSLFSRNPHKLERLVQFYITNTAGTNMCTSVCVLFVIAGFVLRNCKTCKYRRSVLRPNGFYLLYNFTFVTIKNCSKNQCTMAVNGNYTYV